MKTQSENPAGLHLRYIVSKASGEPVDPRARYFVLRFDNHGGDPEHTAACRKALLTYAEALRPHLPQLSYELVEELFRLGSESAADDAEWEKMKRDAEKANREHDGHR